MKTNGYNLYIYLQDSTKYYGWMSCHNINACVWFAIWVCVCGEKLGDLCKIGMLVQM